MRRQFRVVKIYLASIHYHARHGSPQLTEKESAVDGIKFRTVTERYSAPLRKVFPHHYGKIFRTVTESVSARDGKPLRPLNSHNLVMVSNSVLSHCVLEKN